MLNKKHADHLKKTLERTPAQNQERANIRNAYYPATKEQCEEGVKQFTEKGNMFAVKCIQELMADYPE